MRLEGKVAIVPGAGQGIGRAIALTLARKGTANDSFLHPNGRVVPIKDTLFVVQQMRTIWP